jgi:mRNA-degrading endonuclease RelE of RelBE toxin-antitoxin system
MEVIVRKDVYRKMQRFPQEAQEAVLKAIGLLQHYPVERLDIKKLEGAKNIFRLRIGKYRLLFILTQDKIIVFDADVRGRIY